LPDDLRSNFSRPQETSPYIDNFGRGDVPSAQYVSRRPAPITPALENFGARPTSEACPMPPPRPFLDD